MKAKRTYRVRRFGLIARILAFFVDSPLTPLIAGAAILLGSLAVYLLPRQEEPQIVEPMVDIFVALPGASAEELADLVLLARAAARQDGLVDGYRLVFNTGAQAGQQPIQRLSRKQTGRAAANEHTFDPPPPDTRQILFQIRQQRTHRSTGRGAIAFWPRPPHFCRNPAS